MTEPLPVSGASHGDPSMYLLGFASDPDLLGLCMSLETLDGIGFYLIKY